MILNKLGKAKLSWLNSGQGIIRIDKENVLKLKLVLVATVFVEFSYLKAVPYPSYFIIK